MKVAERAKHTVMLDCYISTQLCSLNLIGRAAKSCIINYIFNGALLFFYFETD